jgi:hypothetical protein
MFLPMGILAGSRLLVRVLRERGGDASAISTQTVIPHGSPKALSRHRFMACVRPSRGRWEFD